jgi:hypothetical protein
MTQEKFNELPLLLRPKLARAILSCDEDTLETLRQHYPTLAVRLKGMHHYRYRKQVVAQLAGLHYK